LARVLRMESSKVIEQLVLAKEFGIGSGAIILKFIF
jgi:hypothetical protein